MKLIAQKPILLGRDVLVHGQKFTTHDQHGRELVKKGYAVADIGGDDDQSSSSADETAIAESAAALVGQNQTEAIAAIAGVKDVAVLKAAIDLESAGKPRKGVTEALLAALAAVEG